MLASRSISVASIAPEIYDPVAPLVHITVNKSSYRPGETISAVIDVENGRGIGEFGEEINHQSQTNDSHHGKAEEGDLNLSLNMNIPRHSHPRQHAYQHHPLGQHHDLGQHGSLKSVVDAGSCEAVVIDELSVELRGVERLDPSWVQQSKTIAGGIRPNTGEHIFLQATGKSILKNVLVENGGSRSYSIRITLPKVLPPSYRGTCVRYHYYLGVHVTWSPVRGDQNSVVPGEANHPPVAYSPPPLEVKLPLRIWTLPDRSGLTEDELGAEHHHGSGGIVPLQPLSVEVRWRERQSHSRWVADNAQNSSRADDEELLQPEEPYLQLDSIGSSVNERHSSFSRHRLSSPSAGATVATATISEMDELEGRVLDDRILGDGGLEGSSGGGSDREGCDFHREDENHLGQERESLGGEGVTDRLGDRVSSRGSGLGTPKIENGRDNFLYRDFDDLVIDDTWKSSTSQSEPSSPKEGSHSDYFANGNSRLFQRNEEAIPASPSDFLISRGRTYNIRIDDEILVRFTPRRPESTYYLGDVVAGMLTFPRSPNSRECLAVSVLLETQEVVNPLVLHPSRKATGTRDHHLAPVYVPQIQTEFHEVTAHLHATHFIFTIPMDASAAFATPLVSLQWVLRFQFVSTTLQKKGSGNSFDKTERGEWTLPIVVHAPLPRPHSFDISSTAASLPFMAPNATSDRVRRLVASSHKLETAPSSTSDRLIGTFGKKAF